MRSSLLFLVAICLAMCTQSAFAGNQSIVFFTHPTKATGRSFIFVTGDPRYDVEPPGKCGSPFLAGTIFGIPDPRIKNPSEVCAHGKVYSYISGVDNGSAPLSILPIEAPMPVEGGAQADAAQLIRDMLPKLDKLEGDRLSGVLQLRKTILGMDVANSVKILPQRQSR